MIVDRAIYIAAHTNDADQLQADAQAIGAFTLILGPQLAQTAARCIVDRAIDIATTNRSIFQLLDADRGAAAVIATLAGVLEARLPIIINEPD